MNFNMVRACCATLYIVTALSHLLTCVYSLSIPSFSSIKCGKSPVFDSPRQIISSTDRIVGGETAPDDAFPWTLALLNDNKLSCGAVLVHERFALTAAHCVARKPAAKHYSVRIGSEMGESGGHVVRVGDIRIHHLYDKFFARAYDYALLLLEEKVPQSASVEYACLPTYVPSPRQPCVIAGWGRLQEEGARSVQLRVVDVPIVPSGICNDFRHYSGMVHVGSMLCAGKDEGGADACQGDSGGPLICARNGRWQVHGLVSWGWGCALPGVPGVYSKVLAANAWVRTQAIQMLRLYNRRLQL